MDKLLAILVVVTFIATGYLVGTIDAYVEVFKSCVTTGRWNVGYAKMSCEVER